MTAREFNFDGIVGPTHNYAGLSFGNVASEQHQNRVSSPRQAALQGLEKMKRVADRGVEQCVLPPLLRPDLQFLRSLGFTGTNEQLVDQAYRRNPALLAAAYSASNMWTANAATVTPSADSGDGRLHLTPANLSSNLHRSIEPASTTRVLRSLFADTDKFMVHDPLAGTAALSDEGAANHTRLVDQHGNRGLELFVYGCQWLNHESRRPRKYPARQTLESVQAIARHHGLAERDTLFIQQDPSAIDAGVFHNDVISVGNENVLICHEQAFLEQSERLAELKGRYQERYGQPLHVIEFRESDLSLPDAVSSYLFNSQLLTRPDGKMTFLCPEAVRANRSALACTEKLLEAENPVDEILFMNLKQSMNNGGGPACLRLRITMNPQEELAFHQGVRWSETLHEKLRLWINNRYRDRLSSDDLRDPDLITETRETIEQLCDLLDLPRQVLIPTA
ncbi:MAG: N-succinylarginine dihydrolase [Planctomycetota bacterium]|nr:N-succinylarginine dihydrolase [Planctomycetota bacterium]